MKTTFFILLFSVSLFSQTFDSTKLIGNYKTGEEFLSLTNKKIWVTSLRGVKFTDTNIQVSKRYKTSYRIYNMGEFRPLSVDEYNNLIANSELLVHEVKLLDGERLINLNEWNENLSAEKQTYPTIKIYATKDNVMYEFMNTYNGLNFANLIPLSAIQYYKSQLVGKKILKIDDFNINSRLNAFSAVPKLYKNEDLYMVNDIKVSYPENNPKNTDEIFIYVTNLRGELSMLPLLGSRNVKSFDEVFIKAEDYDKYVITYNTEVPDLKRLLAEKTIREREEQERYWEQYVKEIKAKYGEFYGSVVLRGDVVPGMSKEMMFDAFNHAEVENRTVSKIGNDTWESYMFKTVNRYVLVSLRNGEIYSVTK